MYAVRPSRRLSSEIRCSSVVGCPAQRPTTEKHDVSPGRIGVPVQIRNVTSSPSR